LENNAASVKGRRDMTDMLDDFPEDGTRDELLEGMLLVTPASAAPSMTFPVIPRYDKKRRRPK